MLPSIKIFLLTALGLLMLRKWRVDFQALTSMLFEKSSVLVTT